MPYQSLVSTNRFEENKSYTICGAIDPRTNKRITLSQAIKDGIIDAKNGTYVNIKTGEAISINHAIETNQVLTEPTSASHPIQQQQQQQQQTIPVVKREIITLNIEYVKDPRTDRNLTVSEAIHIGLLDRQSLNYHHPLTNESLSLNKAYQKGYIIGYYTDSYQQTVKHQQTTSISQSQQQSFFIISVFDPVNNRSMTLDQAIKSGLFDYNRAVYIHPITKEIINITDSVRKGLIDAQIYENGNEPMQTRQSIDTNLPIGDFGIDKRVTSMRTKFNADGTSILQIDIESTMPTRGVYEIDEIEELNNRDSAVKFSTTGSSAKTFSQTSEFRQVVDINSVHRVNRESSDNQRQVIQIIQPINNIKQEKNVVVHQISKEFGLNLDSKRV